jgi:hypothetical protein
MHANIYKSLLIKKVESNMNFATFLREKGLGKRILLQWFHEIFSFPNKV